MLSRKCTELKQQAKILIKRAQEATGETTEDGLVPEALKAV